METRNHLGKFYQEHYKTGVGAEVGCHGGTFSKILSEDWKGKILSIDYFDPKDFLYQQDLEQIARDKLKDTKCEVIKGSSVDVAKTIEDGSLDWVYIDADHQYESAKQDLATWFPKVRKGGVFSGHDYIKDYYVSNIIFGVWKAVDEFCAEHNYKFELTTGDCHQGFNFASWFLTK